MKWKIRLLLLTTIIMLITLVPFSAVLADEFILYEYYTTGPDLSSELYLSNYFAQTFTVNSSDHLVNRIRLNLSAEGATPGNIYVSIRATTTAGTPNDVDLSTGSLSGTLLPVSTTIGAMYEVQMTPYTLKANTKYAIVCYGTGTTNILNIHWYLDNTASSYAGGSYFESVTAGINWTANTSRDFMFEVYGSAGTATISNARVFSGYSQTDDWLVVLAYNCSVPPYYPYYPVEEYWNIQLLNASNGVVAQNPMLQWGMKPGSIYLSAASASALEWANTGYKVRIIAKYNSSIYASYNLTAESWAGNTMPLLDSWALTFANEMDDVDNPSSPYISQNVQHGSMLSLAAGVFFDVGIPQLSTVRPNIFEVKVEEFANWQDSTFTNSYATDLDDWETTVGTELTDYFNDAGDLVDMDGRYVGGMLVFIGFIVIAALAVTTGHLTAGATLASVVLFGGVVLGLIPIAIIFVYIVLLTIMFIKNYWFGGT